MMKAGTRTEMMATVTLPKASQGGGQDDSPPDSGAIGKSNTDAS